MRQDLSFPSNRETNLDSQTDFRDLLADFLLEVESTAVKNRRFHDAARFIANGGTTAGTLQRHQKRKLPAHDQLLSDDGAEHFGNDLLVLVAFVRIFFIDNKSEILTHFVTF